MKIINAANALREYFDSKTLFKLLLKIDVVILVIALVVRVLDRINLIKVDSAINTLAYIAMLFSLVFLFSNLNFKTLFVGFAVITLEYIYALILAASKNNPVSISTLIYMAVYGYFCYASFKVAKNVNVKNEKFNVDNLKKKINEMTQNKPEAPATTLY